MSRGSGSSDTAGGGGRREGESRQCVGRAPWLRCRSPGKAHARAPWAVAEGGEGAGAPALPVGLGVGEVEGKAAGGEVGGVSSGGVDFWERTERCGIDLWGPSFFFSFSNQELVYLGKLGCMHLEGRVAGDWDNVLCGLEVGQGYECKFF